MGMGSIGTAFHGVSFGSSWSSLRKVGYMDGRMERMIMEWSDGMGWDG